MVTLPDVIVVPLVTDNAPVLVTVTLPPPTFSRSIVSPVDTCGEPVLTVALSLAAGAPGVQFASFSKALSAVPVQTDCAAA